MGITNKHIDYLEKLKIKYIGTVFSKLTVKDIYKDVYYILICLCECGREHSQSMSQIVRGKSTRCKKCSSIDSNKSRNTYRAENKKEYRAWQAMKSRCSNPKNKNYHRYGGRGITFCNEWADFNVFFKDMGCSNGLTLDRENNNGNYDSKNCRWVSMSVQTINRSSNIFLEAFGEKMTVKEWSDKLSINRKTILYRFHKGLKHEDCLKLN